MLAKHLGNRQHDVCGGHSCGNSSGELETHYPRNQHRYGLAQHGGLCFDSPNAPAENSQAVDHRGVRVRAHTGVRERLNRAGHLFGIRNFGEVLDVHLVDDAGSWWHNLEVVESVLTPTKELVSLAIAPVFNLDVSLERVGFTEKICNHRVVDHQFCW